MEESQLSLLHGIPVVHSKSLAKGEVLKMTGYIVVGTKETTVTTSRQLTYDLDKMKGNK